MLNETKNRARRNTIKTTLQHRLIAINQIEAPKQCDHSLLRISNMPSPFISTPPVVVKNALNLFMNHMINSTSVQLFSFYTINTYSYVR